MFIRQPLCVVFAALTTGSDAFRLYPVRVSSARPTIVVHMGVDDRASTHRVVLIRHGESTWNRDRRHIGWTDVPLTERGEREAERAGRLLRREGFEFDLVFSSVLRRALKTQHIVMNKLDQVWVPEMKDWRLNERHYGDLIGKTRDEARESFGPERVEHWASSYDEPPFPMNVDGRYYPKDDIRYRHLRDNDGRCTIPRTESMKDVSKRSIECWEQEIAPNIQSGKRVLIAGHANMLKTLLQHLDGISDSVVVGMSIPRATPIVYDLDRDLKPIRSPNPRTHVSANFLGIDEDTATLRAEKGEINAF